MPTGNGNKSAKFPQVRARGLRFAAGKVIVLLSGRRELSLPLADYPTLQKASPTDRNQWELIGNGRAFHWENLDLDLSLDGFIYGLPERIPRPTTGRGAKRTTNPTSSVTPAKARRAG